MGAGSWCLGVWQGEKTFPWEPPAGPQGGGRGLRASGTKAGSCTEQGPGPGRKVHQSLELVGVRGVGFLSGGEGDAVACGQGFSCGGVARFLGFGLVG